MKFVIQVVKNAEVAIIGESGEVLRKSSIGKGFAVLVGIRKGDTVQDADRMVQKLIGLRIFADENGKTNLALKDVDGGLLLVSQFTLYADMSRGNRPSFLDAAAPDEAIPLYEYIVKKCKEQVKSVGTGEFGARMELGLINDGPFTVVLNSYDIKPKGNK